MTSLTKDSRLIADAFEYVVELYRELTQENGAPTLGTQNQAVDFILADPELRRSVAEWAHRNRSDATTTASQQRLPYDHTYWQVATFLRQAMEVPVFERKDRR